MEGNNLPENKEDLSTGSDSDSSTTSSSSDTEDEGDCCTRTTRTAMERTNRTDLARTTDMTMETEDGAVMNVDSWTSDNNTTGPAATSFRTPAEGGADTTLVAGGPGRWASFSTEPGTTLAGGTTLRRTYTSGCGT